MFLICFDIANRNSFLNISQRWLPEINQKNAGTPIVIVGTKGDFRDERPDSEVSEMERVQALLLDLSENVLSVLTKYRKNEVERRNKSRGFSSERRTASSPTVHEALYLAYF